jgi:fumarate hydratase, class II
MSKKSDQTTQCGAQLVVRALEAQGITHIFGVHEVISNRCCQLAGAPLGSKHPVHPNDHVNMSQSSNDSFPSAMCIAAAVNTTGRLIPAVKALRDAIAVKAAEWDHIVKIGRTHMQDATTITLGQEWSGYAGMLSDNLERIEDALKGVYRLALGGTAVGTGINAAPGFAEAAAAEIAGLTRLPFVSAPNKFTVQGAHDALVQLSGTFRTLAASLYKIGNDIRLMSCGPRAGFAELMIPENEPGSSIMPGKVNPTQVEALTMIAVQVMANDIAVGFGGAGGYLEMNVYKPLIIFNLTHSLTLTTDRCTNFCKFLIEGTKPNLKKIAEHVDAPMNCKQKINLLSFCCSKHTADDGELHSAPKAPALGRDCIVTATTLRIFASSASLTNPVYCRLAPGKGLRHGYKYLSLTAKTFPPVSDEHIVDQEHLA